MIVDVFEEEFDFVYKNYLSSELKTNHYETVWQVNSDKISENRLRQGLNIEVTLETDNGTNTGEALTEWVEENDELRLHYMEFPFKFNSDDGYIVTTFGKQ